MLGIGVQTQNAVKDDHPEEGFALLHRTGFTNCDFSLNGYPKNTQLYRNTLNKFFDQSAEEMCEFFRPHREAAKANGITINQMHMPYPIYIPTANARVNDYLHINMIPKSMKVCEFLGCPNIVIHGLKMAKFLGSEEAEWQQTAAFLDEIAPIAKEIGTTICMENLYESGGAPPLWGGAPAIKRKQRRISWRRKHRG